MYPRLRDGDLILFYRLDSKYYIGDVVTFKHEDGNRYTARIVAQGGDTVDMDDGGKLLVNGNAQDEEIFYPTYKTDAVVEFPCQVLESRVFLLCDMRTEGIDSRTYGTVLVDDLDGKVMTVLRRRGI